MCVLFECGTFDRKCVRSSFSLHNRHRTATTLYTAADIEGHVGSDGRFYMLDFSRMFPPTAPEPGVHRGYLYQVGRERGREREGGGEEEREGERGEGERKREGGRGREEVADVCKGDAT